MIKIGVFNFQLFSAFHLYVILVCVLLGFITINIHKIFKKLSVETFTKAAAISLIIIKIFDSIIRVVTEKDRIINVLPLNLCNITIIICAYYLYTKKDVAFALLYYFSFGAILGLIFPDFPVYHLNIYVYIFAILHAFELIFVIYACKYLKPTLNTKNTHTTRIFLSCLIVFNYTFNAIFKTNYMFLNDNTIPIVGLIENKTTYSIVVVILYFTVMQIIYLLTKKYASFFKED